MFHAHFIEISRRLTDFDSREDRDTDADTCVGSRGSMALRCRGLLKGKGKDKDRSSSARARALCDASGAGDMANAAAASSASRRITTRAAGDSICARGERIDNRGSMLVKKVGTKAQRAGRAAAISISNSKSTSRSKSLRHVSAGEKSMSLRLRAGAKKAKGKAK